MKSPYHASVRQSIPEKVDVILPKARKLLGTIQYRGVLYVFKGSACHEDALRVEAELHLGTR
jgi:hypothetical protein